MIPKTWNTSKKNCTYIYLWTEFIVIWLAWIFVFSFRIHIHVWDTFIVISERTFLTTSKRCGPFIYRFYSKKSKTQVIKKAKEAARCLSKVSEHFEHFLVTFFCSSFAKKTFVFQDVFWQKNIRKIGHFRLSIWL